METCNSPPVNDDNDKNALDYHRYPRPGKIEVTPTKPLANQRDLALAYSPGVAAASLAIANDPAAAAEVTARSNLVAVISNGTAVLGLGNIGPLAAKPVMEGKAVLFKKFAGIDVFDLEINEKDPEKLVEIIASLEPTFGGINLEDIKSPECFMVEGRLRGRMNIPVFHDDQHGTAIIVGAAVLNGLRLVGKDIREVRLVCTGAGASGIACLKVLEGLGLPKENMIVLDRQGVLYVGRRGGLEPHKKLFATRSDVRTLGDALKDVDIFLGLSGPGVLKQEMVRSMARDPLVFALSNPIPEILPEEVQAVRPDAVIATGRSDYPNQVNNVLCFPFIFRGALDVGATTINEEMKLACVHALADLAMEEAPDTVVAAYGGMDFKFGRDYLIPKPFDPRLILKLAPAVARAACESGVATRPVEDIEAYRQQLTQYVFESILVMRPVFERAKTHLQRLVYAEGELASTLRAVQNIVDEKLARPVLIGDPAVIAGRIEQLGLRLRLEYDAEVVAPEEGDQEHHTSMAAAMVRRGEANGMICGLEGHFHTHLDYVTGQLGLVPGVSQAAAMNIIILKQGVFFICDVAVTTEPDSRQLADMTLMAADIIKRFGMTPRAALLSHSNNVDLNPATIARLHAALAMIHERDPELEVDGQIRADAALDEQIRRTIRPDSPLRGQANLLVMPNIEAARIAYDLIKTLGDAVSIGPVLLGLAYPVHILTASATVRRIVNVSALAAVDAQVFAALRSRQQDSETAVGEREMV